MYATTQGVDRQFGWTCGTCTAPVSSTTDIGAWKRCKRCRNSLGNVVWTETTGRAVRPRDQASRVNDSRGPGVTGPHQSRGWSRSSGEHPGRAHQEV